MAPLLPVELLESIFIQAIQDEDNLGRKLGFTDILSLLLVSKQTYNTVLPYMWRDLEFETSSRRVKRLSDALYNDSSKGHFIKSIYMYQDTFAGRYDPMDDLEFFALQRILGSCTPSHLEIHTFDTVPELLESVKTDRLEHLEICVRTNSRSLPDCEVDPWLHLVARAAPTLRSLHIGGRLLALESEFDPANVPHCPQLERLDTSTCVEHRSPTDFLTYSDLYMSLMEAHQDTLRHINTSPLQFDEEMDLGEEVRLPLLASLSFGVTQFTEEMAVELDNLRDFATIQELSLVSVLDGSLHHAAHVLIAKLQDAEWLPQLRSLDCSNLPRRPADLDTDNLLACLQLACQTRGLSFFYD